MLVPLLYFINSGCILECRETPTSQVTIYPSLFILWMAVTCVYRCLQFRSLVAITYIAYEGEGRDGYRDQIVTCDVGVSLHSKTHPLFMKYSNGTSTQCYAYHYPSLFPVLFLQSLYVPFYSLVSTLFLLV